MGVIEKLKLDWIWLKLSYTFRFAHHPLCDKYSDQRFQIGSIHLCQGCTLVTIGGILSFIVMSLFVSSLTVYWKFIILISAAVPPLIIDGFRMSRFWKRFARLSLGHGIGGSLSVIIFDPNWLFKGFVLFLLILSLYTYRWFREFNQSEDLCKSCEYLPDAPYCPGLKDQMKANKEYQDLALPVVNSSIKSNLERKLGTNLDNQENETSSNISEVVWVDE